ncbi:MAG: hypothetical protein ACRCX2_00630 [Paraclostridium sp.]
MALLTPGSGFEETKATFDDSQTNFIRGIMRPNYQNLLNMSPFQPGRFYFIFTKMPTFMESIDPDGTKRFQNIVEKYQTGFQGLNDMQANFGDIQTGTPSSKFSYVTTVDMQFDEFTVNIPHDLSKLPLLSYLEMWMTGVYDPMTGLTHYHGDLEANPGKYPEGANLGYEVAEGLYIALDRAGKPVRSMMIYGIQPTKGHHSQLNSEKGTHDAQAVELSFKGILRMSADINRIAKSFCDSIKFTKNYLEFKHREDISPKDSDQTKYGN